MRNLKDQPFYGVLKEYRHWVVLFREKQVTIGSCIIMSKELDKTALGDVSTSAWTEFSEVCKDTEGALKIAFGADKFNYLALMMVDPEVHFHVIPRYANAVMFNHQRFADPDWPGPTKRVEMILDEETKIAIKDEMIKAFSQVVRN